MGGVPRGIVPDNLKSAVTKADNYEADVNRNLTALSLHYGTTILPTRSRKPKDKPLVERAVTLVYQRIYYPLNEINFYNLIDLNAAIRHQLDLHNNRPFQNRPYSRRELFSTQEKDLLEALPVSAYEQREYWSGKINKDALVYFKGHYYSVPYQWRKKRFYIQATTRVVEIFWSKNHQRLCMHPRSYEKGKRSIQKDHLPPNIQYVKNWSVDFFIKQAQGIGEQVEAYFLKIFEQKAHPEQAYKICTGIIGLKKNYNNERINQACERAAYFGNYGYKVVAHILKKGLDQVAYLPHATTDDQPLLDESHPNIRGGNYYK